MKKQRLSSEEKSALLAILEARFDKNPKRHPGIGWETVVASLKADPGLLAIVQDMEDTGGEPDVVLFGKTLAFCDCSAESPSGRRSLCYDREGWESRKEHRPQGTAVGKAEEMGLQLLDEEKYRILQSFGPVDLKTSSWLLTPEAIRRHGGSIFGDRRYDSVFVYHNGAQSYYAARGFRGYVEIRIP